LRKKEQGWKISLKVEKNFQIMTYRTKKFEQHRRNNLELILVIYKHNPHLSPEIWSCTQLECCKLNELTTVKFSAQLIVKPPNSYLHPHLPLLITYTRWWRLTFSHSAHLEPARCHMLPTLYKVSCKYGSSTCIIWYSIL
jgi:hypothetical protein